MDAHRRGAKRRRFTPASFTAMVLEIPIDATLGNRQLMMGVVRERMANTSLQELPRAPRGDKRDIPALGSTYELDYSPGITRVVTVMTRISLQNPITAAHDSLQQLPC
jgi:hypothetical protein